VSTPTVLVLGDSVPAGERTDATRWPDRVPTLVEALREAPVRVHGGMGTALVDLAADIEATLAEHADAGPLVVLVHAGHNDAQVSGGEPRVTEAAFREGAAALDGALGPHPAVDRHAFVGLVPLLPLDEPGCVPFADGQPARGLAYDDALGEAVETHLPVARPVADWRERTADGVHPNGAGHAAVAETVASWLTRR
jgi:lysophospholipase L1-like esterase